MPTTLRAISLVAVTLAAVPVLHTGCGDDSTDDGDGDGPQLFDASCSSCQEAYTLEQCTAWGEAAGCEGISLETDETRLCDGGLAGCHFDSCVHNYICADDGAATCASCEQSFTQADCDTMAAEGNCDSATLIDVTACGEPAKACDFLGCDFAPDCPD